jgi:nitrile hydratase accessory protein
MTATPDVVRAALHGAEPPIASGEPVFAEPWEGRAYGLALEMMDRLGLPWELFRQRLISAIADAPDRPYYASWVAALEALVLDHGAGTDDELRVERAEAAAYRYDEDGADIEVTPIAGDVTRLDPRFGQIGVTQVELYRRFFDGVAVEWGRRAFDTTGNTLIDEPVEADEWVAMRDRLLSFEPARPG